MLPDQADNYRQWNAVGSPDDGHKDARNMLRYYWLPTNHYLLHLVGLSFSYTLQFRTALFWAITQRVVVIPHRLIGCSETSVRNDYTLRNSPEGRSSRLRRDGSLKSRMHTANLMKLFHAFPFLTVLQQYLTLQYHWRLCRILVFDLLLFTGKLFEYIKWSSSSSSSVTS